jgi:hypothetical protein
VGGSESGSRSFRAARDEYSVDFRAGSNQAGISCETSSSQTLPVSLALKPDQEQALRELGFADPGENPHFTRQVDTEDDATLQELSGIAIKVLSEILRCETSDPWEMSFFLETGRAPRTLQYLVVSFLNEFLAERGTGNILMLESGRIYAQLTPQGSQDVLNCEVISNKYLPPDLQLSPEKLESMESRGFACSTEHGENYHKEFPVGDSKAVIEIAKEILSTFAEVYGLETMPKFKLTLTID